jgi:hypothetical protein
MRYLFLDDIRMPADVTWICIPDVKWEIVRSYNEAVQWVIDNGYPNFISFDHDLGYEEYNTDASGIIVVTNSKEEKSGYDFAKFLVEHDLNTHSMPVDFNYIVHSMNPIGAASISNLLKGYIRSKIL